MKNYINLKTWTYYNPVITKIYFNIIRLRFWLILIWETGVVFPYSYFSGITFYPVRQITTSSPEPLLNLLLFNLANIQHSVIQKRRSVEKVTRFFFQRTKFDQTNFSKQNKSVWIAGGATFFHRKKNVIKAKIRSEKKMWFWIFWREYITIYNRKKHVVTNLNG